MDEQGVQYEQQPSERRYTVPGPLIEQDNLRFLEQSDDVILSLEKDLKNEILVRDESSRQAYWSRAPGAEPLMNDAGIRYVCGVIRTMANKNTYMSNLKQDRIYEICLDTALVVAEVLFVNRRRFEIREGFFMAVNNKIWNFMELALSRAKDEGERKALYSRQIISTQRDEQQPHPQGGAFSLFAKRGEQGG